tara:strand:- start:1212 stop:1775 length:564 start_codon:yes stop_codon:yes gene_type:complete
MAKITPTLSITSNSSSFSTVSEQGPLSIALSLSTSQAVTCDLVDQDMYTLAVDTRKTILDGSVKAEANGANADGVTGSPYVPGTMGCYIYIKNTGTTNKALIGLLPSARIDADDDISTLEYDASAGPAPAAAADNTSGLSESTGKSFRTMTLLPGEFLFMPHDYTGDIVAEALGGTTTIECWLFDRA